MSRAKLILYRAALKECFPELEITQIKYLSEGWDSVACLVNRHLIFRFPKREEVSIFLEKELALLPELASKVPVPIPQFTYRAIEGGRTFPFGFAGYEMLRGRALSDCPAEVFGAEWWKREVGAFLGALHSFPVERAQELGLPEMGYRENFSDTWYINLINLFELVKERIFPLVSFEQRKTMTQELEDYLGDRSNFEYKPVVIHQDLDPEHILLDLRKKRVSGIIDFGDCAIGDAAFDVPDIILPYYPLTVDDNWQKRRSFYLRLGPFQIIDFGLEHNDPALVEYGMYRLQERWFNSDTPDWP